MKKPLQVFCCYARKDQSFLLELKDWLKPFQRAGLITIHADVDISPGEEWEQHIIHYSRTLELSNTDLGKKTKLQHASSRWAELVVKKGME